MNCVHNPLRAAAYLLVLWPLHASVNTTVHSSAGEETGQERTCKRCSLYDCIHKTMHFFHTVRLFRPWLVFQRVTSLELSPAVTGLIDAIQEMVAPHPGLPTIASMEGVILAVHTVSAVLDPADWAPLLVPGGVNDARWFAFDIRKYLKLLEKFDRCVLRHLQECRREEWEPFTISLGLPMDAFVAGYVEVFNRWDRENLLAVEERAGKEGCDLSNPDSLGAHIFYDVFVEFAPKRESFAAACIRVPGKPAKLTVGPNDVCPCRSGKKAKYCHLR